MFTFSVSKLKSLACNKFSVALMKVFALEKAENNVEKEQNASYNIITFPTRFSKALFLSLLKVGTVSW